MLLHAVHEDAVVLRRSTSVVLLVGVVILPVPQVHSNRAQMHLVEVEEEELLHDKSTKKNIW